MDKVRKGNKQLKQKAMQMYCLLRLLPIMVGEQVPEEDPYWKFYLELREIVDVLFSQSWTQPLADHYQTILAAHLKNFTVVFPGFTLPPKHHYLLHYGTFAMKTGPPYRHMTSSEEIKGNAFKRTAHVMCNFKNVPLSLANKHQLFSLMHHCSSKRMNDYIDTIRMETAALSDFSCAKDISGYLNCPMNSEFSIAQKFVVSGQLYHAEAMLPISFDDFGNVVFGQLIGAIITSDTTPRECLFCLQLR